MTKHITFSSQGASINSFFERCKTEIEKAIIKYPNNYIEVSIVYYIGKGTDSVCNIDIEESELRQRIG